MHRCRDGIPRLTYEESKQSKAPLNSPANHLRLAACRNVTPTRCRAAGAFRIGAANPQHRWEAGPGRASVAWLDAARDLRGLQSARLLPPRRQRRPHPTPDRADMALGPGCVQLPKAVRSGHSTKTKCCDFDHGDGSGTARISRSGAKVRSQAILRTYRRRRRAGIAGEPRQSC
jgi:hypothetical protein